MSSSKNKIEIILSAVDKGLRSSLANTSSMFGRLDSASKAYKKTLTDLDGTADHFKSTMLTLAGIIGGGALFSGAARQAASFNSTVEQSRIGVAALVRTFTGADMETSFTEAESIQKRLQIAGLQTTATYEELLRALQEGIGPALRENFNPDQIVAFTTAMTQAAAALALPMDQLGQEIRSVLDADIGPDSRIAKALQISNDDVKGWKEAGMLFENLQDKLKAFSAAGEQASKTFSGAWSNVIDAVGIALGKASEQSFEKTTSFLLRLKDAIVTVDEAAGTFTFNEKIMAAFAGVDQTIGKILDSFSTERISEDIANFVGTLGTVFNVLARFASMVLRVGEALGPLGPYIAGTVTSLALFGLTLKTVIGLPMLLYRQIMGLVSWLSALAGINFSSALASATAFIARMLGLSTAATAASASVTGTSVAVGGLGTAFTGSTLAASAHISRLQALSVTANIAAAALMRVAVSIGAFYVGFKAGEALYRAVWMSQASKDLEKLRLDIEKTKATYEKFASFTPETKQSLWSKSSEELDTYRQALGDAYRYQGAVVQGLYAQSKEKGLFGNATDEAKQAEVELVRARQRLKELEQAMEEYGIVVADTNRENASSTDYSASTMRKVTGEALKEMQKKYQEYAKEIQRINSDISGRTRSLYAELRDMARSGMSDYSAWKNQKAEAEEYARAAKQAASEARSAMAAGDEITAAEKWKEALQYADDSKAAYKALNTEVKDGERVVVSQQQALKTAMDGVKEAGTLGIDILKEQREAAKGAMDQLKTESGFADLTKGMDDAEKKWLENWKNMADDTMDKIEKIDVALDAVANKKRTAKLVIEYEDGTREVSSRTYAQGGLIGYRFGGMIQALASGGGVRNILSGGFLPGFGGGDRRLLLGEDGEVMLNKFAVKAAGLKAALAFNEGRFDIVLAELSKRMGKSIGYRLGGLVHSLPHPQALATGGAVAAASSGSDFGTINLSFPTGSTVPVQVNKSMARELLRQFEQMGFRMNA